MESENSSVLKNKSKTFKVFAGIKKIKKFVPHNFYFFFLGIFLEFILIIIYTILLGSSVNNYFQNSFYPIQSGIINFCQQYSSLALSTGVTIEYEYQILNMTVISNDTNYNNFYNRIIERSFTRAKTIIYNARNSPQNLEYQNVYQNEPTLIVEIFARPKFLRVVSYFDYIDGNLKFLLDDLKTDFKTWEFDILIFLQRNYPFFLNPSARIFAEIQSSFLYYIMELSNKMSSFLIIFVVIMIVIKVFEIYNIGYLYLLVQKLVLIFLRCNQKEALREYQFLQDILESNEKKDDFLFLDFTEKVKMKENENAIEKNKRIHKISLEKNKKKVINSYSNISPLKKTKGIVFIVLTTCLSLFYYFLNNIYWNEFNSKINNIINLDISFASMYVYSVSVLILNNLYIREMLITSPSYEYLQNIYQQPSGRRTYFYGALNKRITTITNIFNKELQLNVIPAAGKINDPNFELLLNENLCDVLKDLGKIEEDENVVCNRIWGGVFKNGIIMGVNQYLQELQEISPLRVQIADKNSSSYQNLIKNITKYIEDPLHQDFYLGEYFLSEALFLLYGFINEYFNPLLEQEKISTQTTLFLTMSFLIFIFCSLAVMIFKYMRNYYKYLALSISIMPFEKITEDEATMQIIENFTKNFS